MSKTQIDYPCGVQEKHIPYISFFSRVSIFRYVRESIKFVKNSIALIWHNFANTVDFEALTWISWKFTRIDLIHNFSLEFTNKTRRVNNTIYGMSISWKKYGVYYLHVHLDISPPMLHRTHIVDYMQKDLLQPSLGYQELLLTGSKERHCCFQITVRRWTNTVKFYNVFLYWFTDCIF